MNRIPSRCWLPIFFLSSVAVTFLLVLIILPSYYSEKLLPGLRNTPDGRFHLPPFKFQSSEILSDSQPTFLFRETVDRTGVHEGPMGSLDLKTLWKFEPVNVGIHTASKASPAVDGSGVYVGSDAAWFYAFDPDGHLRWKYHATLADAGFHSTAALDLDRVYVGSYNGMLYCFLKTTGRLIWATKVGGGLGASPVIFKDSIFITPEVPPNGYLARVKRDTGTVLWRSAWFGNESHSSPAIDTRLERVYVGDNNGRVHAYNLNSGQQLWQFQTGKPVKSTPVVVMDTVYVSSWSKKLYALDTQTGHLKWSTDLNGPSMGSPTYCPHSDMLVVPSYQNEGVIHGIQRRDGKEIWKYETDATLLIASGVTVHVGSRRQEVVIITCAQDAICAFDPASGKMLKKLIVGGLVTGVPTVFGDDLLVSSNQGELIRFGP